MTEFPNNAVYPMNHHHGASRYWIQQKKKKSDKNVVLPHARKDAVKQSAPITATLKLCTINLKGIGSWWGNRREGETTGET